MILVIILFMSSIKFIVTNTNNKKDFDSSIEAINTSDYELISK